jgi:uncharacterized protein
MAICKSGVFRKLREHLGAVGRMAFTNYLLQSVIMTFIFYGWGLGYFAKIDRFGQFLIVLGVWILQIVISPMWLKHFKFGPAEWLWRTLTYWKTQPFKRKDNGDMMAPTAE